MRLPWRPAVELATNLTCPQGHNWSRRSLRVRVRERKGASPAEPTVAVLLPGGPIPTVQAGTGPMGSRGGVAMAGRRGSDRTWWWTRTSAPPHPPGSVDDLLRIMRANLKQMIDPDWSATPPPASEADDARWTAGAIELDGKPVPAAFLQGRLGWAAVVPGELLIEVAASGTQHEGITLRTVQVR